MVILENFLDFYFARDSFIQNKAKQIPQTVFKNFFLKRFSKTNQVSNGVCNPNHGEHANE